MSKRSAKFISAFFASILAGTSFAAVAQDAAKDNSKENSAKTADTCLTRPKGALPAGGHWYYRTDHATKRNCWYIGEAKNKTARAAPKESSSAPAASDSAPAETADAVSPQQSINARKSIANARAELTAPQARVEDLIEPKSTGAVPVASIANSQLAATPTAPDAPPSSIASRWPESSGVTSSSGPRLAAAEPAQSQQAQPPQTQSLQTQSLQTQDVQTQSLQTNPATAPPPAVAPVALAVADASQERRSASMQMLLLVMAGALALAGITASLVYRFGRAQAIPLEARSDRRAIWDSVPTERTSPSMFPDETPVWRSNTTRNVAPQDLPRDPRAPDDPERRVTEMLARLARSAHT
ncbi:hypothetical protein JQ634_00195 [Bradyrhizobium sp. AUGA SZCCT0240]|uniref:hypothetical protein n=1 Tax=unclassified Bradyrhizobium TaxID=2631580 RepID=UPI001BA975B1|nr:MULTISPECIES: hypothetical protein [unclassified Bradyrhizobium]MBR1190813.1 hypothetical protein [Bradyrhizobium sp. AUGA SZCCT0160]MBR1196024.1 hypothetical protein [Bradyrhizobium sp. AUGA SZCCT0158]MBR1240860.1 hypothetical protein [Bradyrhizobium sp. AUGA SZCCT0274]MBR1246526.1 hypothetical protein [Bradyrhizobium sp. AUGA SZCCT0169]MBR1252116.1 hypothetical protein [Bradyrhizobium sp. AUGA SZCCT0240]